MLPFAPANPLPPKEYTSWEMTALNEGEQAFSVMESEVLTKRRTSTHRHLPIQ